MSRRRREWKKAKENAGETEGQQGTEASNVSFTYCVREATNSSAVNVAADLISFFNYLFPTAFPTLSGWLVSIPLIPRDGDDKRKLSIEMEFDVASDATSLRFVSARVFFCLPFSALIYSFSYDAFYKSTVATETENNNDLLFGLPFRRTATERPSQ